LHYKNSQRHGNMAYSMICLKNNTMFVKQEKTLNDTNCFPRMFPKKWQQIV